MKDLLIVIGYALRFIAVVVLVGAASAWVTQAMVAAKVSMLMAAVVYGAQGFLVALAFIAPAYLRKPKPYWGPQPLKFD